VKYLVATLVVLASCLARADDAAFSVVGSAGTFVKNNQIRMVSEDVRIDLSNAGIHVVATFWFRNEGKRTDVTMAFPEDNETEQGRVVITKFLSTVDGRSVKVKRTPAGGKSPFKSAWVKRVHFRARQTRRVVAEYWAKHGDIGDYIVDDYVLQTGASWKGKIGRATITVDWSKLNNTSVPSFEKAVAPLYGSVPIKTRTLAPRRVRMTFRNFEPDFDVEMTWAKAFWNYRLNGKPVGGSPMPPNGRGAFVGGTSRDPTICAGYLELLLDHAEATDEWHPKKAPVIRGKRLRFEGRRTLWIGRRKVRLARPFVEVGGRRELADGKYVYVRDLVKALGGRYLYNPAYDRASIRLP
jgi:hypothetical protein